jgi:hypothetical protein
MMLYVWYHPSVTGIGLAYMKILLTLVPNALDLKFTHHIQRTLVSPHSQQLYLEGWLSVSVETGAFTILHTNTI